MIFLILPAVLAASASPPTPVSPGSLDASIAVESRCPTFSWSAGASAAPLELVVYEIPSRGEPTSGAESADPVVWETLPAGATSWTAPAGKCLEAGAAYAWMIRRPTPGGQGKWSEPALFRVLPTAAPVEVGAAAELLRRYLDSTGESAAGGGASASGPAGVATKGTEKAGASAGLTAATGELLATGSAAIRGNLAATTGEIYGVHGVTDSDDPGAAGVVAEATSTTGAAVGMRSIVQSAAGTAGLFENVAGGEVLSGISNGFEVFEVSGNGTATATAFVGDGSGLTGVAASDHTHQLVTGATNVTATATELNLLAGKTGTVWTSTNDGDSSGLDADTLDGKHASDFVIAMVSTAGPGNTPTSTRAFLSPLATVTVAAGQKVLINATQSLGSTTGAGGLDIYPCYRVSGSTATPTAIGGGIFNLTAAAGQRHVFTISGVVSSTPGTYDVGMCGDDDGDGNWNNNEWGYVSAIVTN